MHHEPRSFLSNAKAAGDLVGADTILGTHNHPQCTEPFIESDRTILKNCPDLGAILFAATFALPECARFQIAILARVTARTDWTMRPAYRAEEIQTVLRIGEEFNGFLKSSWELHGFLRVC